MKKMILGLGVLVSSIALFSCGEKSSNLFPDYDQLEGGLYMKKIVDNAGGRAVQVGDIVTMNMKYTVDNDTVIFDSQKNGQPVQMRVDTGKFKGDFLGIFVGMKEGDSASVIVKADTFFIKTAGMPQAPDFVDSTSMLYFNLGISKVQTMEEIQAEQSAKNAEMEAAESTILANYLAENGIQEQPTESGLIFISKTKGSGKQAVAGKKIKVNYAGKLIDGTYFDTSIEEVAKEQGLYDERRPYQPFEFVLGQGQVIRGWDEGLAMMKEGGKATLIIPSSIGYGANPRPGGVIKPFNTLIFDVELIEVMD
jgi:FKBP-type peptidyl-prolyl cis-trans isomerase